MSETLSAEIVRESFTVGRYRCTMTASPDLIERGALSQMNAEWQPDLPRRLSKSEWRQYRAGRDRFYARLGAALGGKVMVVEV
jgi:hypothetical protein